ncbi:hypothetical protein Aperf_G00000084489 [Anoplocephala perfoliata]
MHAKCSFNWVSFYMYTEDFEQPFLQQTQKFYAAESETLLAQTPSFMLYINNVDQRIEEEISRIYHCFDTSTGTTYVEVLEQGLISRRIDTIVSTDNCELKYLLEKERYIDIIAIMRGPVGLKAMRWCITSFVRERLWILSVILAATLPIYMS